MLYLDHAATTPTRPGVAETMEPFLENRFGNPSGIHAVSRQAKDALEDARERVAAVFECHPLEVVFTGGGTEADNLALKGAALAGGGRRAVVTVATEHEAVLESAHSLERFGCAVTVVGVDDLGRVDPDEVASAVVSDTAVVSVMWANNETGVIQPVAEIAAAVKKANSSTVFHSDAVQAAVSEQVKAAPVDLLTIAGHKLGGPKGVGVLVVKEGVALEPVVHGGGQELGRRSGTHNVAGAVGLATALDMAVADRDRFHRDVGEARRRFETAVIGARPDVVVNAPTDARLVQHSHLRVPGIRNETVLIRLDQAGVAASAGSACQSGASSPSHVLTAMGLSPAEVRECLRITFGWNTTPDDGDQAAKTLLEVITP